MPDTWNHRMAGAGRDLCGSSSPTPLLKQGHGSGKAEKGTRFLQLKMLQMQIRELLHWSACSFHVLTYIT